MSNAEWIVLICVYAFVIGAYCLGTYTDTRTLRAVAKMDADLIRAGVSDGDTAIDWFADLWEHIHGPGSWSRNDWVWAVTFKWSKK